MVCFTLTNAIAGVLMLFSAVASGSALPEAAGIVTRATASVCLSSGSVSMPLNGLRAIARERSRQLGSPPWIPNCFELDLQPEAQCLACQNAATVTYSAAMLECATASFGCGVFEPVCLAGCMAAASFALYGADQACYCAHANCADYSVRSKGRVVSTPVLEIGGGHFTLDPRMVWAGNNLTVPKPGNNIPNCWNRGCK